MTGETLEEKIRCHAPGTAVGYYLIKHRNDKESLRYPEEGAFRLKPFSPPSGAPFGSYLLYFVRYETDKHAMAPVNAAEDFVRIQLSPSGKATGQPIGSDAPRPTDSERDDADEADEADVQCEVTPAERMAELEVAIASTPAMITARADFEKQRMAMELAENNQDLLNKGHFSRDAAEALALNRAYRREVQVVLEAQSNISRRTAEEVQSAWAVLRKAQEAQADGIQLLKEQLREFARPTPPPPPIDYTPAIVEGLKSLRDFGVALVQARAGIPFAAPQPASSALPNQSAVAKLVPETSADSPTKEKGAATGPQSSAAELTSRAKSSSAAVSDAEDDVIATCGELLDIGSSQAAPSPTVAPVTAVSAPTTSAVSGVIDPMSADAKTEASRLLKAFAETSEIEALFALMSPEQLQKYLQRLRQRAARNDEQYETPKK